ncbi:MAG: aminotransferase class III-fold pyridoxal phosphate-dependent enzyme [Promethearchaeota archaeon]
MKSKSGQRLWENAKKIIPGGTQLLSKRAEMFLPGNWPSYFKEAKGVEVIDLDGNSFIDMTLMGVGSCLLGYADDGVNEAVKSVIDKGSMCTLNSHEELDLAELLLKIHPWASLVRYARTGGEAMAIAVRIARAWSGREKVAFCGYHGWHDWYLSCNLADNRNLDGHLLPGLEPKGVPRSLLNTAIPFSFNDILKLEEIVEQNDIGAIIIEPYRYEKPRNNFLENARKIADDAGAALIFDEITSGWRNTTGGVHLEFGVIPDIAVFAKAMSNGYPMAAIIGKMDVMDVAEESFISSTYWTERIGPAASIATINKLIEKKVPRHVSKIGSLIGTGWKKLASEHELDIEILEPNSLISFSFNHPEARTMKTFFTQEMLKRGYLASTGVYVSFSHEASHVDGYLEEVDAVFSSIRSGIDDHDLAAKLEGPVAHAGFQRLTN